MGWCKRHTSTKPFLGEWLENESLYGLKKKTQVSVAPPTPGPANPASVQLERNRQWLKEEKAKGKREAVL